MIVVDLLPFDLSNSPELSKSFWGYNSLAECACGSNVCVDRCRSGVRDKHSRVGLIGCSANSSNVRLIRIISNLNLELESIKVEVVIASEESNSKDGVSVALDVLDEKLSAEMLTVHSRRNPRCCWGFYRSVEQLERLRDDVVASFIRQVVID